LVRSHVSWPKYALDDDDDNNNNIINNNNSNIYLLWSFSSPEMTTYRLQTQSLS